MIEEDVNGNVTEGQFKMCYLKNAIKQIKFNKNEGH